MTVPAAAPNGAAGGDGETTATSPAAGPDAHPPAAAPAAAAGLPDMAAALAVKVVLSATAQADPAALAAAYDAMAARFAAAGLDAAAVAATARYFDFAAPRRALLYSRFPAPLPPAAVRLGAIFLQRSDPALAAAAAAAAADVAAALPAGADVAVGKAEHLHVTVFMASHPTALRSDALAPAGADFDLEDGGDAAAVLARARPAAGYVVREVAAMRAAATGGPPPRLRVHRVVLAESGTLLLCCVDADGAGAALRARLRAALPGAPPRQPTIWHASLARVLGTAPLRPADAAAAGAACARWTARLAGTELAPRAMAHVCEERFGTVEGEHVELPLGGGEEN
jgi:hypothetical protein